MHSSPDVDDGVVTLPTFVVAMLVVLPLALLSVAQGKRKRARRNCEGLKARDDSAAGNPCSSSTSATHVDFHAGIVPPQAYHDAVAELAGMSLVDPGRPRPETNEPVWSTSSHQDKAHAKWVPPGFKVSRAIEEDMGALFRTAIGLHHPLAHIEARVPADLDAAMHKIVDEGPDIASWRAGVPRGAAF